MSEGFKPALAAEEWRDSHARLSRHADVRADIGGGPPALSITVQDECGGGYRTFAGIVDADRLPAVMALANAALPAGDPRRFLPQDVDALRDIAAESPCLTDYQRYVVERVAGIIAALLPPREG